MNAKEFLELCPPGSIGQKLAERYTGEGGPWPLERIEKLKEAQLIFYDYELSPRPVGFIDVGVVIWVLAFIAHVALIGFGYISIEASIRGSLLLVGTFLLLGCLTLWRLKFSSRARKYKCARLRCNAAWPSFNEMVTAIVEVHCLVSDVPTPYMSNDSSKPTYYEQRVAMLKALTEGCAGAKHPHWHFLERAEEQMKRYAVERCRLEWLAEHDPDIRKRLRQSDSGEGHEGHVGREYCSSRRLKRLHKLLKADFGLCPEIDVEDCFVYGKEIVAAERAEVMEFSI
jgi:hypothetical protein